MSQRTFHVGMSGEDVKNWQKDILEGFQSMRMFHCPIDIDGDFGPVTRSLSAQLAKCLGIDETKLIAKGITRRERLKINKASPKGEGLSAAEKKRFRSKKYREYRARVRKTWAAHASKVHQPVTHILADSWGYHPGVHDGLDVICGPNAPIFAMVDAKVIDVRSSGWWGKAPSGDVSKGDGIIQIEVLENVGPFRKGMHIGYGHAEGAKVRKGQKVRAGQVLGHAGLAVAWHVHLMVNGGGTTQGRGDRDPRPFLDYTKKHG